MSNESNWIRREKGAVIMKITKSFNDKELFLSLKGRLDTTTAGTLETEIKASLDVITSLIIDITDLGYISSAGLRVLLYAQKEMNKQGIMVVRNPNHEVMDIFNVTGFSDIFNIEKKRREISLDGCTLLSAGMCGECWKVDDETILKLYFEGYGETMAQREKTAAKIAFVAGIPTAISYDLVACGNRQGVLYELLNAETLSDVISRDKEHLDKYAKMFAELSKVIHTTKAAPIFPDVKDIYRSLITDSSWMTKIERKVVISYLDSLPDADTCLHGDLHTSNIMMQNGEPLFIDMGDFCRGYYLVDIAQIYSVFYRLAGTPMGLKVSKLEKEDSLRFYNLFLKYYFSPDENLDALEAEIKKMNYFKALFFSENASTPELRALNQKIVRNELFPLLGWNN
jgi:uncharacterized protein (TIGR02172 family)